MTEPITSPATEKPEEMRIEHEDIKFDGYDSYGLVKSRYDELSLPRTLWVFKRVVLVSLAVYTGYVCEGFEVSEVRPSRRYTRWCLVAVITLVEI